MPKFTLENRYFVLERKDVEAYLTLAEQMMLVQFSDTIVQRRAERDNLPYWSTYEITCIVIEKDWPEYPIVLEMLRKRVEGDNPEADFRAISDPEGPIYKKAQEMLKGTTIPMPAVNVARMHEECDDCLKQHANPPKCGGHRDGETHCIEFESALIMCSCCGKQHRTAAPCKQDDKPYQCGCGYFHRPSERCGPY